MLNLTTPIGDLLLYISVILAVVALAGLICEQLNFLLKFSNYVKWLIRGFSTVLFLDFILLSYYFAVSDFSLNYVWAFSSKYYPLYYRLSGALAGQQGTLLFWAALIGIGSLWLNETKDSTSDFVKKTQIIVIFLALYFSFLTLLDSPFKTIHQLYLELPKDFIPEDGNGLNPLLLDPWMATHPLTTFLGYAGTTVPFAGALVYLYLTFRGKNEEVAHRIWIEKGIQWLRVSWLFSTLSMAFGGIWAYKTLGWGGFWAWDPVETAMLLPWLMLTGAIHTVVELRRNKERYNILAPVLVSFSFSFVVYATMVTRSGIFESVHSFISGNVGKFIIILAVGSFILPLVLGIIKYLKTEKIEKEENRILNRTNIFYAAILVILIITFISFFGITYPPIIKSLTTKKYAVTVQFFNLWIFPFFIIMLLLVGLGLHYHESIRRRAMLAFIGFSVFTLIAGIIKPNENFNIIDYTAIVSSSKPLLYRVIGSTSALSIIPPSIYIFFAAIERWRLRISEGSRKKYKIKELGIISIHLGVVLISLGIVFSSLFTSNFSATLSLNNKGQLISIEPAKVHEGFGRLGTWGVHSGEGWSPYSIMLLDYKEIVDYGSEEKIEYYSPPGISVSELYNEIAQGSYRDSYTIRGIVEEVIQLEHNTYIKLVGDNKTLWVAVNKANVPRGIELVVYDATLLLNFTSQTLNKTFDIIVLSPRFEEFQQNLKGSPYKTIQQIKIDVYKGYNRIGGGVAKVETYKNGIARRPLIDRSLLRDVFVIFDGVYGEGEIPITVKLKPLINEIWLGIIFFILGIIMTILSDTKYIKEK